MTGVTLQRPPPAVRTEGDRVVYAAREYEPVDVQLRDLLDESGRLQLSSDVEGAGYFTVNLKQGRVQLQTQGYVGLIPLTERVSVNVIPRVPVSNLSRMLRVSEHVPQMLSMTRTYAMQDEWWDSLLDFYAAAMIGHVETIASNGLLTHYERREERSSFPRGRVLMTPTVNQLHPRGINHAAVISYFQRTADTAHNRCIKYALWFLASRYQRVTARTAPSQKLHQRINAFYHLFDGVQLDHRLRFLEDTEVRGRRPLPTLRAYYRDALDVAVAIVLQHAVRIETEGDSLKMPSLVLNMNKIFEAYLRNVLRAYARAQGWLAVVLDGNTREGKKLLFDAKPSEDATPDIVLRHPDESHPVLIEVKNIPAKRLPDRDAINQVMTYAMSYRCPRVVLARPRGHHDANHGLKLLGAIDRVELYQYVIDLGAERLEDEDQRYGVAIGSLLERPSMRKESAPNPPTIAQSSSGMSAGPRKKVRANRQAELAAVRATRAVFEDAGFISQPVDGSNDIGKDAYVDLVEGTKVTGELIALQIKGGASYKRGGSYVVPCSSADRELWRASSVPVFGVVHDPDNNKLHWTNLTAWARSVPTGAAPAAAPVHRIWTLDGRTLPDFVNQARSYLSAAGPPVLLDLASVDNPQRQRAAILDAFALARHDPRPLLLVRASLRYLRDRGVLAPAIHALALTIGHGDIFWHASNWLPEETCTAVKREMRWTWAEVEQLIAVTGPGEWDRGGLGQDVSVLLYADPGLHDVMQEVWDRTTSEDVALRALLILVDAAGKKGLVEWKRLVNRRPDLADNEFIDELRVYLEEFDSLNLG